MKKAIVIGATSGIGKALTLLLADGGYYVGITGRRKNLLDKLVIQKPGHFFALQQDVSQTTELTNELDALVNELGGLDLLVFSAGTGELNEQLDLTLELPAIAVNVKAFNEVAIWAYEYFQTQQHGHLVVISSIAGLRGSSVAPAYNASKAYQINYLEGLRQKARKQNLPITITDVRPGFVDTAMAKGGKKFWVTTPEKAAKQILNAIESKKSVIYVSKRWILIAWLFKILPRFLYERM